MEDWHKYNYEHLCSKCGTTVSDNGLLFIDVVAIFINDQFPNFFCQECAKRYNLIDNMNFKNRQEFDLYIKMINNKEKTGKNNNDDSL